MPYTREEESTQLVSLVERVREVAMPRRGDAVVCSDDWMATDRLHYKVMNSNTDMLKGI